MGSESHEIDRSARLTDEQIATWLLGRLRNGPECLSELARELVCSSRDVERVMHKLRDAGLVEPRAHRCPHNVEQKPDEIRWGLAR